MSADGFIHEDFLLDNAAARSLYHEYAEHLPIIDYHCHLPPGQIAKDHRYRNMTEAWLSGDHYKWRAMRTNGVPERFCTGDATDREKFDRWAETVPHLLRNPLYAWAHLELARYFGIEGLLGPDTAEAVWEEGNRKLAQPGFSCRGLMKMSNVALVCTTDDPTDSLEAHRAIAEDPSFDIQVLPTWRPDKAMAVDNPKAFNAWMDRLAAAADMDVRDFDSCLAALRKRQEAFHARGCRLSDHGLETAYADEYSKAEVESAFMQLRGGRALDATLAGKLRSAMLYECAVMDFEKGWTQQFHFGALRNNNSRMFRERGADIGLDSIADIEIARPLSRFLDRLDSNKVLARTILYNLNPKDNAVLVTMAGNFQDGSIPGKIQYGSAWWFLDQQDGIERQIEDLSQMGLLGRFVGMLTDSRSFLSYPRHEYFRRILCNVLGSDMEKGRIPHDIGMAGRVIRDICYGNAAAYFGFNLPVLAGEGD